MEGHPYWAAMGKNGQMGKQLLALVLSVNAKPEVWPPNSS